MNFEEKNSKVSKSFKKRIKRNNCEIVNMGTDSNVVCTIVASSSVTGEENSSWQVSVKH